MLHRLRRDRGEARRARPRPAAPGWSWPVRRL